MISETVQPPNESSSLRAVVFLSAMAYSIGVMAWFYDCSWWPPDEGVYAHVADRVLEGEVLNRDIQNIHPGYVVFANATAFKMFGKDLVSLRYPLIVLAVLSSGLIFLIAAKRSLLGGFVSSVCVASLSTVQFLNPTAHWYCFFLFALTIGVLVWLPPSTRWRIELVGFLVTTIFQFRQLTGVIAAIAVVAWFLHEMQPAERGKSVWVGRGIYLIMFAGLSGYLYSTVDTFSFLTYGVWPLGILLLGMVNSKTGNREVLVLVARLLASAIVGLFPLISYHAFHGSLGSWFDDTFLGALQLAGLNFLSQPRYLNLFLGGALEAGSLSGFAEVINGLFWMVLVLLPAALGIVVFRSQLKQTAAGIGPLPFMAVFYAIVSVHFQISDYLFFTLALTTAGLMNSCETTGRTRYQVAGLLLFCSLVGICYHAGQPEVRYEDGKLLGRKYISGERFELVPADLPRASLRIEQSDRELYRWLLGLIEREVAPDESIFALPMNAELYFLSGRNNPYRIYCTTIGINNEQKLNGILSELRKTPPTLVFFRPDDKYNSEVSRSIMQQIRKQYDLLESRYGFEVYRIPEQSAPTVGSKVLEGQDRKL